MTVEGMWCFVSADVVDDDVSAGGILVLDSQRIYGGDGVIAHIGQYTVENGVVSGEVESFQFNFAVSGVDVFDQEVGPSRSTRFRLQLNENGDGTLVGLISRDGTSLPIALRKLRDFT